MAMSAIDCDYLDDYDRRRAPLVIPQHLTAQINRKAASLAAEFEARARAELTSAARRHLRAGQTSDHVAWQVGP
ncbi:hypothetical protein BVH03_17465 [Pseudomonas sp. PA15(2017)]|nr:hypothetical protein BVH03_17465 [Pseudomonas sp. PA15(2017)]